MPQIFSLAALEPDESETTLALMRRERNTNVVIRLLSFLVAFFAYNLLVVFALQTKSGALQVLAFIVAMAIFFGGVSFAGRIRRSSSKPREVSRVQALKAYIHEHYGLEVSDLEAKRLIWSDNPLLASQIPDKIPHVTIGTMRGYSTGHLTAYPNDVQMVFTKEDGYMLIDTTTDEELGAGHSHVGSSD